MSISYRQRSQQTRQSILAAAERAFMEHGFHATRLEDIAREVGIKRTAIAYYFKGKGELYEEVLSELFGGLLERLRLALDPERDLAESAENAVLAWTEYLIDRPALPRILLREIADSSSQTRPALIAQIPPFVSMVGTVARLVEQRQPERTMPDMDALHVASAIAGATIFFELIIPTLLPQLRIDLTRDELVAEHKRQILRMTRLLLQWQGDTKADPNDDRGAHASDRIEENDDV
jgi:TetR/AcrR family transcriptional regulator